MLLLICSELRHKLVECVHNGDLRIIKSIWQRAVGGKLAVLDKLDLGDPARQETDDSFKIGDTIRHACLTGESKKSLPNKIMLQYPLEKYS